MTNATEHPRCFKTNSLYTINALFGCGHTDKRVMRAGVTSPQDAVAMLDDRFKNEECKECRMWVAA